jgi:hypothetical protein
MTCHADFFFVLRTQVVDPGRLRWYPVLHFLVMFGTSYVLGDVFGDTGDGDTGDGDTGEDTGDGE